jgi:hypothetical protein
MARGPDHRTGYEEITGQTPDISQWLDFEFYNHVWWGVGLISLISLITLTD